MSDEQKSHGDLGGCGKVMFEHWEGGNDICGDKYTGLCPDCAAKLIPYKARWDKITGPNDDVWDLLEYIAGRIRGIERDYPLPGGDK